MKPIVKYQGGKSLKRIVPLLPEYTRIEPCGWCIAFNQEKDLW